MWQLSTNVSPRCVVLLSQNTPTSHSLPSDIYYCISTTGYYLPETGAAIYQLCCMLSTALINTDALPQPTSMPVLLLVTDVFYL